MKLKFQEITKELTKVEQRSGKDLNKSEVDGPISMFLDYLAYCRLEDVTSFIITECAKRRGRWAKRRNKANQVKV